MLVTLGVRDNVCAYTCQAYYRSKIRKNRTKHIPIRGIKGEEVPKILLRRVIVGKDLKLAEKELLALPGLNRYKKGLRSKAEEENFLQHLRKYIEMYQTDCAWEVSTTNRYTITTYEASVTSRRRIRQGDTIKYLTGTLVPLTTEESADLDLTNRNFSIVVSARKKNSSIFLGPARFANHDCDANGRLVTRGDNGMEVIAMKNIEVGDEITVSYGDDYFGPANIDCLCHTCEHLERNGWTSKAAVLESTSRTSTPNLDTPTSLQPRSLKRKRNSNASFSAPPSSKHAKTVLSPSKLQQSWTPPDSSDSEIARQLPTGRSSEPIEKLREATSKGPHALSPPDSQPPSEESESPDPIQLDRERPGSAELVQEEAQPRPKSPLPSASQSGHLENKTNARLPGTLFANAPISPAPTSASSHGSSNEPGTSCQVVSQKTLPNDSAVTIKVESVELTKLEMDDDTIVVASSQRNSAQTSHNAFPEAQRHVQSKFLADDVISRVPHAVSMLTTTTVSKEIQEAEPSDPAATETNVLPSIEAASTSATIAALTVHPVTGTIRIAGDYLLTRKLLAQPHDRWVQCHNEKCLGFFIQPNGYQTRRECPRCERHSMLYGFPWPKTDPDPRKLLERKSQSNGRGRKSGLEYSAYRRQGKQGKGTWYEGGGDPEERVLDHRTIHRFVNPDEEREMTRKGLLKEAEDARATGDHMLAILEARISAGSTSRVLYNGTESVARDTSESGSTTPDGSRRRSNRFVTRPVGVYTDSY